MQINKVSFLPNLWQHESADLELWVKISDDEDNSTTKNEGKQNRSLLAIPTTLRNWLCHLVFDLYNYAVPSHEVQGYQCKVQYTCYLPLSQPILNYSDFLCRFYTYGDMPLLPHLEQIDQNILQHFSKSKPSLVVPLETRWQEPVSSWCVVFQDVCSSAAIRNIYVMHMNSQYCLIRSYN